MKASFASSILLAAGVVAAIPARAAAQSMTLGSTPAATESSSSGSLQQMSSSGAAYGTSAPPRRFGWAGVGIYHVSRSVDVPGFGSVSGSSTYLGVNAGAALDIFNVAPDLPLSVFGNAALAFGSDLFVPLTAGAAVHYDRLPISLLGGLGLTVMPNSAGAGTPIGLGIIGMASYPLPQVRPGLAAMAQLQYHFLSDGFSLFVFDVGISTGF
jgi:hypothetical protein